MGLRKKAILSVAGLAAGIVASKLSKIKQRNKAPSVRLDFSDNQHKQYAEEGSIVEWHSIPGSEQKIYSIQFDGDSPFSQKTLLPNTSNGAIIAAIRNNIIGSKSPISFSYVLTCTDKAGNQTETSFDMHVGRCLECT